MADTAAMDEQPAVGKMTLVEELVLVMYHVLNWEGHVVPRSCCTRLRMPEVSLAEIRVVVDEEDIDREEEDAEHAAGATRPTTIDSRPRPARPVVPLRLLRIYWPGLKLSDGVHVKLPLFGTLSMRVRKQS